MGARYEFDSIGDIYGQIGSDILSLPSLPPGVPPVDILAKALAGIGLTVYAGKNFWDKEEMRRAQTDSLLDSSMPSTVDDLVSRAVDLGVRVDQLEAAFKGFPGTTSDKKFKATGKYDQVKAELAKTNDALYAAIEKNVPLDGWMERAGFVKSGGTVKDTGMIKSNIPGAVVTPQRKTGVVPKQSVEIEVETDNDYGEFGEPNQKGEDGWGHTRGGQGGGYGF